MNDPFSTIIRKYIPWDEYQNLKDELSSMSLIDKSTISQDQIKTRINELEDYEYRFGFVYVGEKKWLKGLLLNSIQSSYATWVIKQMNEVIFTDGLIWNKSSDVWNEEKTEILFTDLSASTKNCWSGYTENISLFPSYVELEKDSFMWSYVSLSFPKGGSASLNQQLQKGFEILHNLPYYREEAKLFFARKYSALPTEEFFIREILMQNEDVWEIDVSNEYSATFGIKFNQQEAVDA